MRAEFLDNERASQFGPAAFQDCPLHARLPEPRWSVGFRRLKSFSATGALDQWFKKFIAAARTG